MYCPTLKCVSHLKTYSIHCEGKQLTSESWEHSIIGCYYSCEVALDSSKTWTARKWPGILQSLKRAILSS